MGVVEIPSGDKETPSPPSEQPQEETSAPLPSQPRNKNKKPLILTGILALLVVAAVLVGVLPDWKDNDSIEKSSSNNNVNNNNNNEPSTSLEQEYLVMTNGTFNVTLPLFSKHVTDGYSNQEEFKNDLKEVAKFLLNAGIKSSAGWIYYNDSSVNTNSSVDGGFQEDGDLPQAAPDLDAGESVQDDGSGGSDSKLEGVDAYDTNNQEFTIDRADFVKSDGTFVYAAYSDTLVVFSADGQGIISQTKMTPLNVTVSSGCGGGVMDCMEPMPVFRRAAAENGTAASDADVAKMSGIWPGWSPKARIEALLLHGDRLTAVVSGYGLEYAQKLGHTPAIYEYLSTRVQVYDINSGSLQLVSEKDVNGFFMQAYSKGEFVHIVTRSSVNTWDYLMAPMDRSQVAFQGLDDAQYAEAVTRLVDEGLLDTFVDKLITELEVSGPVDLARLSFFIDSIAADNSDQDLYGSGLATSISQVVSFDMTAPSSTVEIQPHMAATFHPGSWGHVYAMGSMIIVADVGWSWIAEENVSSDKTYLICFSLIGASSSHSLVGSVEGSLLNPFSIDFVEKSSGSYVRVATTQSTWTPWVGIMEGDVVSTSEGDVMPMETEAVEPVSDTVTAVVPESSTLNQIIVLKVPSEATGVLGRVGSVKMGEPNERFTSVRFFDDFAYAVTFEKIDPFYVVDLSSEQPVVAGELKVSGFSEYLHPIDSNDKLLLAIGQDADETGTITGFQISLFDATLAAQPTLVDRLVVENDENSWSGSSASWDERAFRFLPLGEAMGKLIVPMSIYTSQEFDEVTGELLEAATSQNFEGFSVFNVENGVITKDFDIDHSYEIPYDETCMQWYEWLPERSFVFDGNVVTMKKHTIISSSLLTGETLWTVPITASMSGC